MKQHYMTVKKKSKVEYEDRRSRFIARVCPVETEKSAFEFINTIREEHRDATHNVYAYNLWEGNVRQKYSDDGEPSGTAGMPIIEAIKNIGVINLVVVVTRYFGGTLLGAAGLIRAYGKAGTMVIKKAEVVTKTLCVIAQIEVDYSLFGRLQNALVESGYHIENIEYMQNVIMIIPVSAQNKREFEFMVNEITSADAIIKYTGQEYIIMKK